MTARIGDEKREDGSDTHFHALTAQPKVQGLVCECACPQSDAEHTMLSDQSEDVYVVDMCTIVSVYMCT